MVHVLERLPHGGRVTVIRLRSLGDCVLTTPALHLLKQHRPDLVISVVAEPRFAPIFHGNPDVDHVLPPEPLAVARERASLCLNLHGGTRSMALTAASVARFRAGFAHHRYRWVYNTPIPRAQQILGSERTVHTAEHIASAMFFLGVPQGPIPRARLFPSGGTRLSSPYAVIHPFAAQVEKTWTAEGFLSVARHLQLDHHLEPVFIGSSRDDMTPFGEYRCFSGAPLPEVMSLLSGATLFVGNDSGPAHMAAAFGVAVLVLFGTSDPVVWAPWRTDSQVIVEPQGIARVPRRRVLEALDRLRVRA